MAVKAVLFDLDGTLIDSEKHYMRFWPIAAKEFGFEMSHEQALSIRSLGRPFIQERFREWYGDDSLLQAVRERCKEYLDECVRKYGIEPKPGGEELLFWLKEQNIPAAVVTASGADRAERALKAIGLFGYFSRIISATMVEQGKPAPDVYLYACAQMGLEPSECIAIEDSPNGAMSAYRAGCRVIMVPDQDEPEEELVKLLWKKADSLSAVKVFLQDSQCI